MGETYASFYNHPRTLSSIALSKFQGLRYRNLLQAAKNEPMIIQYFAGLYTSNKIEKLDPIIDVIRLFGIFKPFWLFLFHNLADRGLSVRSDIVAIVNNIRTSSKIPIYSLASFLILSLRFYVFMCLIHISFPFWGTAQILGFNIERSRRIKFALMKYRCSEKSLNAEFPNENLRNYIEKWFSRVFQDSTGNR